MNDMIDFDHAAGTPVHRAVYAEILPWLAGSYGNPSSIHTRGMAAKRALENSREQVAALINASPKEIYFTSCGTESNNLAVKGIARAQKKKGNHIIVSAIDHQSILKPAKTLERSGYEVSVVGTDKLGFVDPGEVASLIREDTVLVSITHASNEIGTIEPIREIAALVKEHGTVFHTDAVQVAGVLPVDVEELGVDMLTLAANAFYGPPGAAALYIRDRVRIHPLLEGGVQERGRRSGTENVPAVVGMGKAAELARAGMEKRIKTAAHLRDRLMAGLESSIPRLTINGDRTRRLPGNVHVSVEAVEGESMVFSLAGAGILAASGSSCADKTLKSSHVLQAIGCHPALANASVLFTPGYENTDEEVDRVLEVFPGIVERFRAMSPLWND